MIDTSTAYGEKQWNKRALILLDSETPNKRFSVI